MMIHSTRQGTSAPALSHVYTNGDIDRAGAYADGLFETIAFYRGGAPFWDWHMQRLQRDALRLALSVPKPVELLQQATALAGDDDCVLRLTLSRAHGHGYWPQLDVAIGDRSLSSSKLQLHRRAMPACNSAGLVVDWAEMHLSSQPLLAGIKHLARLEQVLAASEAQQRGLDELLLCDQDGFLVEAISSNVLVYLDRQWLTPAITHSGVSGVLREWLLAQDLIKESRLHRSDLNRVTAVALCNSVRGIQRVSKLAGQALPDAPAVLSLADAVIMHVQAHR
jgi:4-amino-4-deoxychorismate lyase